MKRKPTRMLAIALSCAMVGTSLGTPVTSSNVIAAESSSSSETKNSSLGEFAKEYTVVSSDKDDGKLSGKNDVDEKEKDATKKKHPEYWCGLDANTDLTKNPGEDLKGSGIVSYENNENIAQSDMDKIDFKYNLNYIINPGTGVTDTRVFNYGEGDKGTSYQKGDVVGFQVKPMYSAGDISIIGVSPYKNYTGGKVWVGVENEDDLDCMTLEYYSNKDVNETSDDEDTDPTLTTSYDLSELDKDSTGCIVLPTQNKNGWYYLTYADDNYFSDGMGDEVTGSTSKGGKGQLFGFSFYVGDDIGSQVTDGNDYVTISKDEESRNIDTIKIAKPDYNENEEGGNEKLYKIQAHVMGFRSSLKYDENYEMVAGDSNSDVSIDFTNNSNYKDCNAAMVVVREYYKGAIGSAEGLKDCNYKTFTRVKVYYSDNSKDSLTYKNGVYTYNFKPNLVAGIDDGKYFPSMVRNFKEYSEANPSIELSKATYGGKYTMNYKVPDCGEVNKRIKTDIVVDYTSPFVSVVNSYGKWEKTSSNGSYDIKNGALLRIGDAFSNIDGLDESDVSFTMSSDGKNYSYTGADLSSETSSNGVTFTIPRNNKELLGEHVDKVLAVPTGTTASVPDSDVQTIDIDSLDTMKLSITKSSAADSIEATLDKGSAGKFTVSSAADKTEGATASNLVVDESIIGNTADGYILNITYTKSDETKTYAKYKFKKVTTKENSAFDASKVTVTVPTVSDNSKAGNKMSGYSFTLNFENGDSSIPTVDPVDDSSTQKPAPTPTPVPTKAPVKTDTPAPTSSAPVNTPSVTPVNPEVSDNPSVTETPAPTPTPVVTVEPTEAPEVITWDDLITKLESEGGLKDGAGFKDSLTIVGIPEDITVEVDNSLVSVRPVEINELGSHTITITDVEGNSKSYKISIVSSEKNASSQSGVIQYPNGLTITENEDNYKIYVDDEMITEFPYTISEVGNHNVEVITQDTQVEVKDSAGNPILDSVGKPIIQESRAISYVNLDILSAPASKSVNIKQVEASDLAKMSEVQNQEISSSGNVTIKDIPSNIMTFVDGKYTSENKITVTKLGKTNVTFFDNEKITSRTVVVNIRTKYVTEDDLRNGDIISGDPVTIIGIDKDSTLTIDDKVTSDRPAIIKEVGTHPVTLEKNKLSLSEDDVIDMVAEAENDETPIVSAKKEVKISVNDDTIVKVGKIQADNSVEQTLYEDRPITLKEEGSYLVTISIMYSEEEIIDYTVKVVIGSSNEVIKSNVIITTDRVTVADKDEIDDIINKTPDGKKPSISGKDEVIIDVDEDTTIIVDGEEVTERPVRITDEGKHDVSIIEKGDSTDVTEDDIKDIVDRTPEGEKPTIKSEGDVTIDVPDDSTIIIDGKEVTDRPAKITGEGSHDVVIKDKDGNETEIDVVIDYPQKDIDVIITGDNTVVDEDDIKDIVDKTPEGEKPTIKSDEDVIIDTKDNTTVIIDGKESTDKPAKVTGEGSHDVVIKDKDGNETEIDVIIDNKGTTVDEDDIKDIIDKTPEGDKPTIKDDDSVIIDVPDGKDVTVDGEEVTERPVKITEEGEHDVVIKDKETGETEEIKVIIDKKDDDKTNDKTFTFDDIEKGNTDGSGSKDNDDDKKGGTGSETGVDTPVKPTTCYLNGIVDNGIYYNGVRIINNGYTVYITKDGKNRYSTKESVIELFEDGKYKIEAEKDGKIELTFNIEVITKTADTSKTETVKKINIKDGGVYEGGITIPNEEEDVIYVDGKPTIANPVIITEPGKHEVIIDGKKYTIFITSNTKPDGGTDDSKKPDPIEVPADKIVDGETYPGGVTIDEPENGETVIIDGKVVTNFPTTITGDGDHTIKVGDKEMTITIKDSEVPNIPTIIGGQTPAPTQSAKPAQDNNNKDNSNNNNSNNTNVNPTEAGQRGTYTGVKNKKAYKKNVKFTITNVKSGSVTYTKSKKGKAKVSEFGTGTVSYRATKEGVYKVSVVYTDNTSDVFSFTVDKKKPTLNVKAKKVYKKGKKVKVKDNLSGIKKVTLNGKKCKSTFKIKKKGKYTICSWDKAGNKKTVKIKIK